MATAAADSRSKWYDTDDERTYGPNTNRQAGPLVQANTSIAGTKRIVLPLKK